MIFLILFSLFPNYPLESIFKTEKGYEIRVVSERDSLKIEFKGKDLEVYYKDKDKIMVLQDDKWKEIKKPVYNKENFFISIFFEDKIEDLKIEKDEKGLIEAEINNKEFGREVIKRISFNNLKEIPEGTFPKKEKTLNLAKLKNLFKSEDEKEVSGTAGARGVGEEENLDTEPNYEDLKYVESIKISREELEKFEKEGGLK